MARAGREPAQGGLRLPPPSQHASGLTFPREGHRQGDTNQLPGLHSLPEISVLDV